MNEREAVHVLAVCASYDGRKPSTVDAQTWAYELKNVERDTAVDAVRHFYRVNPDGRIRPGHVTEYVAELRKPGLARSSRIENAAVVALDPDDPEYDAKYMAAIQSARHRAAERPESIPPRVAIGAGEPAAAETRIERNRRRAALAKAAVKPFPGATREDAPDIPENLKRAREVAVEYRAGKAYRDKSMKLGRAGGELMQQINHQRAQARGGGPDGRS